MSLDLSAIGRLRQYEPHRRTKLEIATDAMLYIGVFVAVYLAWHMGFHAWEPNVELYGEVIYQSICGLR